MLPKAISKTRILRPHGDGPGNLHFGKVPHVHLLIKSAELAAPDDTATVGYQAIVKVCDHCNFCLC